MVCLLQQRCQSDVKLDFCFEGHRYCRFCQLTPRTAYWCSKTRFHPFRPYQLLAACGPSPFADIKSIRLLKATWSNMLYTTGCINTYRRINIQRPKRDNNDSWRQKRINWDCHQRGCFRLPEKIKEASLLPEANADVGKETWKAEIVRRKKEKKNHASFIIRVHCNLCEVSLN